MTNLPVLAVVLALLGWIAWRANWGRAVFVVRIRNGKASARRGVVTAEFLDVVDDVCGQNAVATGEVRGMPDGPRIRLRFSSSISEGARQQLRNWWVSSGWLSPVRKSRC